MLNFEPSYQPRDAVRLRRRGQLGGPGPRGDEHAACITTHLTWAQPPNPHLERPKTPASLRIQRDSWHFGAGQIGF